VALDGKTFAEDMMVTALGLTEQGEKLILGFVQTGTENTTTGVDFLRSLVTRGLRYEQGLLVIIDGSKGLRAAVEAVFGSETPVQRCQYHKRENVVAYLPKAQQELWRDKLAAAYAQPTYAEAKAALDALRPDLRRSNESALRSLDEGLEETLTVHRLGVSPMLRRTLATTNMLESVFSLVEQRTGKVDRWRSSDQKSGGWRWHCWILSRGYAECEAIGPCRSCARRFGKGRKKETKVAVA